MNKKESIGIILIFILVGVFVYFYVFNTYPKMNEYKVVTLSGKIQPSQNFDNSISEKPQLIRVYYDYYVTNYLCRNDDLAIAKIDWLDNNTGKYKVTFNIPVNMNVILTTDCSRCDYSKVFISNNEQTLDVSWGAKLCDDNSDLNKGRDELVENARNFLNNLDRLKVDAKLNSTEIEEVNRDIKDGREAISGSDMVRNSNANESLLQAYYAHWFAWRAFYKIDLGEIRSCVEDTKTFLEKYDKDSCFVPEFNAYNKFVSINRTLRSYLDSYILRGYPYDIKDIEKIKSEVDYLKQRDRDLIDNWECKRTTEILNESLVFQESHCQKRKNGIFLFNTVWLIVFLAIGIILGLRWRNGKKT